MEYREQLEKMWMKSMKERRLIWELNFVWGGIRGVFGVVLVGVIFGIGMLMLLIFWVSICWL